jgi:hypothetical protein
MPDSAASLPRFALDFATTGPSPRLDQVLELARSLCPDPAIAKGLAPLARRLGLRHGAPHQAMADAALALRLHRVLEAWERIQRALGQAEALVYLAGPVRGDGTRACMRHNQSQMRLLAQWAQGVLPRATLFVPHCNFAFLDESRDPEGLVRGLAMRSCEKVLSRSDVLVLCADEPSPGMVRETQVAVQLGLPVFQVPGWDARVAGPGARAAGAA